MERGVGRTLNTNQLPSSMSGALRTPIFFRPSLNLHDKLNDRSLTGRRDRKLFQKVRGRLDPLQLKVYQLVLHIEEEITAENFKKLTNFLFDVMQLLTAETSTPKELNELRENFVAFNGGQLLVELLFKCRQTSGSNRALVADTQFVTLALLREVCSSVHNFARGLAFDNEFLLLLFALLQYRFLFDHAVVLLEELLCNRETVVELSLVPNILELLRGFNARQLLYFCRIFVVTLHEPDEGKSKSHTSHIVDFLTHNVASRVRAVDRNQALLVDCGFLLPRLLSLLKQYRFIPNGGSALMSALPTGALLQMLMNIQTDAEDDWGDRQSPQADQNTEGPAANPRAATPSAASPLSPNGRLPRGEEEEEADADGEENDADEAEEDPQSVMEMLRNALAEIETNNEAPPDPSNISSKEIIISSLQVELMFTISALMAGKKKVVVQDTLAANAIAPCLQRIHASIPWTDPPGTPSPPLHIHGQNCDCRPENALRVQFLRMVLNFCDRDADNIANKLLLFSSKEVEEMRPLLGDEKASLYCPALACVPANSNEEGMLSKLVKFLRSGNFSEPNLRFWIGSCIEAALRGAEPAIQVFFAQRGIIKYLVSEVLCEPHSSPPASSSAGTCSSVILQTAFDLLSECVKFNPIVFKELNEELKIADRFDRLTRVCVDRLVDSNVFVRSLVLSVNASAARNGGRPEEQYLMFADFLEKSFVVLQCKLIGAVTLQNINTENLCCLNTSIVFWVFERRKGALRQSVQAVLSTLSGHCDCLRKNFVELLIFWSEYYQLRDRDRQSLQFASSIPFGEWLATRNELLEILTGKKLVDIRPTDIVHELLFLDITE